MPVISCRPVPVGMWPGAGSGSCPCSLSVSEYSSATILPPGDVLRVDGLGNLVIEVH